MKISELNDAERAWIDGNIADLRAGLVDAGYRLEDGRPIDPATLDAAWAAWLRDRDPNEDPNSSINRFGHAFGQYLADRVGLEWKMVEDEYGTDAAIVGQPGDIVIVPASVAAKRFEDGISSFFGDVAAAFEERVAMFRASSDERPATGTLGRLLRRNRT